MAVSNSTDDASILVLERLERWTAAQGSKRLYLMLDDNGKEGLSFTYAEFDAAASNVAVSLRAAGVVPGDRVLLVFPPSLDFLVAFVGCLKASIVAVPVFPPDPRKMRNKMYLFASVAGNSGAKVALTSAVYQFAKKQTAIKEFLSTNKGAKGTQWPDLKWIVTKISKKAPNAAAAAAALLPRPGADDVAFLQYTSGSTSEPKGVVVKHGNLGHNLQMIMKGLRGEISSVNVSWLPQYHDMGLIGSYLGPLWQGASGVYMSPFAFVKNPPLWIGVMSKYGATHTQTPNFGLALALRKYNSLSAKAKVKMGTLDLSTLVHVFNAAEPITVDACSAFCDTFSGAGFPPASISAGYGLAEHTVYVSDNGVQRLLVDKHALEKDRVVTIIAELCRLGEADFPPSGVCAAGAATTTKKKKVAETGKEVDAAEATAVGAEKTGADDDAEAEEAASATTAAVTAAVTTCSISEAVRASRRGTGAIMVGVGWPAKPDDVTIRIVNAETLADLGEDRVGEIWLDSPSKASGYWSLDDDANAAVFGAKIAVADDSSAAEDASSATTATAKAQAQGFLRTGDLGFIHRDVRTGLPELFVCGRLKDLIIVRGRNHYPQDLERTAERVAPTQLRPGCSATFAVPTSLGAGRTVEEKQSAESEAAEDFGDASEVEVLVLLAEVRDASISAEDGGALIEALKRTLTEEHGITPHCVKLLRPRTISKTSSGKIARSWCKKAFLRERGSLDVLHEWVASSSSSSGGGGGGASGGSDGSVGAAVATVTGEEGDEAETAEMTIEERIAAAEAAREAARASLEEQLPPPPDGSCIEVRLRYEIALLLAEEGELRPPQSFALDEALVSFGLDSLLLTMLKGVIERNFEVEVADEELYDEQTTLRDLIDSVAAESGLVAYDDETAGKEAEAEAEAGTSTAPQVQPNGGCCAMM